MENTDTKKNNLLPADFESPEQITEKENKVLLLPDYITKPLLKIDEQIRKEPEGRTSQQHRFFLEVTSELKKLHDLKLRKAYLDNEIETNDFNISEAKIKKNKIDILYFQELHTLILEPELKKIEEKIITLPKESDEIKVQPVSNSTVVENENEKTSYDSDTKKATPDKKREKIICAEEKLNDAIIDLLIDENKLVDDFFKSHLKIFLRSGKVTAKISWKGNKNICTSLFYMLHENKKLKCSKQFLAASIHASFDFIKEGTNTEGSLQSILEDFKPNNSERRIKPGSEYYARFEKLCS